MPLTAANRNVIQTGFYQMRSFPNVIGAIDCTHIRIQSPNSNIGERFRKGYFSINVQAVCNCNLQIINIVARSVIIQKTLNKYYKIIPNLFL